MYKKNIFITARFRTGSTLLWNIFHKMNNFISYYEPLHENLLNMILNAIPAQSRHFHVDDYFSEYRNIDNLRLLFPKGVGATRLFLEAKDQHADLHKYISLLASHDSQIKTPVLQFNRIDFRLSWIKANFPDTLLIHLWRNPRDQWISMIDYKWDESADRLDCDAYRITTWARDLCAQFPFLADKWIRHPYQRHYFLWKLSYLAGTRLSDMSFSYSDLLSAAFEHTVNLLKITGQSEEIEELSRIVKQIIVQRPQDVWGKYKSNEWFVSLEDECEAILDRLGLNESFSLKPLENIIAFSHEYQSMCSDSATINWLISNAQRTILDQENMLENKQRKIQLLASESKQRVELIDRLTAESEERLRVGEERRELIERLNAELVVRDQIIAKHERFLAALKGFKIMDLARYVLEPRLGILYQHPPTPLAIPGRYGRPPAPRKPPRISIVTPVLNQAAFVERTILSVLGQGYPNLEYVVRDGGSTDGVQDILRRHADRLAWVSAPDGGQTQALNLGFAGATGEIMAYLNADDVYLPGTLYYVAAYFERHPKVDVVYGHRLVINEQDHEVGRWVMPPHDDAVLSWADYLPQETMFWRRRIWDKAGAKFDEGFQFAMDWDLILRFRAAGARMARLPRFLGAFRVHPRQKTSAAMADLGEREMARLRERSLGRAPDPAEVWKNVRPYILRHIACDRLHGLGVLKY